MANVQGDCFAGIDAGTTGVRVSVFDQAGRQVSTGYREYLCTYPHPGWIEQDMDEVWQGICQASRDAMAALEGHESRLRSVGLSSQRGTFVLLDEHRNPIAPSVVWSDSRAEEMESVIAERIGRERYRELTGMPVSGSWSLAKLMWLCRHRPDLMERTRWVCNGQEYFLAKLGAPDLKTDPSSLTLNGMMDISNLDWSVDMLSRVGINLDWLPQIEAPGSVVGAVSREAAAQTGLPAGLSLCRGGGDQQCAAVGAGVVRQGRAKVTVGTAAMMVAHLDSPDLVQSDAPYIGAHAIPNKWDLEGGAFAIGSALRWWRDNFVGEAARRADAAQISPYTLMMEEARSAPAGANGVIFHPFFSGQMTPHYDSTARAGFYGLGLQHDRASLLRAVLEGCACEIRLMVDGIDGALRDGVPDLRLTGGGTQGALFCQIITDILQRPVQLLRVGECTVLGAAILGAVAVNAFAGIEEAVEHMVTSDRLVEPNPELGDLYGDLYGQFVGIYQSLQKTGTHKSIYQYQNRLNG